MVHEKGVITLHNYFVSFAYRLKDRGNESGYFDNCIMVDAIDTANSTADQLDGLITRFTEQLTNSFKNYDHIKIINIVRMR